MIGFDYINIWSFPVTPVSTLIVGVVMFICLLGVGKYLLRITGLYIPEPWLSVISIILGVLFFSLAVQAVSMLGVASKWVLISLIFAVLPFGLVLLFNTPALKISLPPYSGLAKAPMIIVFLALLINLIVALAPTTKIDEIYCYMLLPLRIFSDGGLIYYHFPWESAILPNMIYQIIIAPFYALGLPDSANVISVTLFSTLIWFALILVWQKTKNATIAWWTAALMSVGMYSVVDSVTGSSQSFMVLSTAVGTLAVFSRQTLLKDISLSAWVVICSILLLGMVAAKASLIPMAFFLLLGVLWWIIKEEIHLLSKKKIFIIMIAPWIIIYLPIVIWTWIHSGSPLGPLFSDIFINNTENFDPLIALFNREIGTRPSFIEIMFFTGIRWSPLIWISLVGVALAQKLSLKLRILFFVLLIAQITIIALVLPHKARHLGGLQYVFPILAAIFYAPVLINKTKFKKVFIVFAILLTLPWLSVQAFYAKPLMAMPLGLYPEKEFLNKYVPFYKDFVSLDKILPINAKILTLAQDTDAAYSPRPMYMSLTDFEIGNGSGYLFIIQHDTYDVLMQKISSLGLQIGRQVYENINAVRFTFRTPGQLPQINHLRVFEIIAHPSL